MEEICVYPESPEEVNEDRYVCLVGLRDYISMFIKETFSVNQTIKRGIVFYRFKDILIVTYITDKEPGGKIINSLTYLTSLFKSIVYILHPVAPEDQTFFINLKSHHLAKLEKNTFSEYKAGSKFYNFECAKIIEKNFTISEVFMNQIVNLRFEKKEFYPEKYVADYSDFIDRLDILNLDINSPIFNQKCEIFFTKCRDLGLNNVENRGIIEAVSEVVNEVKIRNKELKKGFMESMFNLFLSDSQDNYCKVKNEKTDFFVKKTYFSQVMDKFEKMIEDLNVLIYENILNYAQKEIYSFFVKNNHSAKSHFSTNLKNFLYVYDEERKKLEIESKAKLKNAIGIFSEGRSEYMVFISHQIFENPADVLKTVYHRFDYPFPVENMMQVITVNNVFIFVLKHYLKKDDYSIVTFNPINNIVKVVWTYYTLPELALGSTAEKLVIILNKNFKFEVYQCDTTFPYEKCYENNSEILCPIYLKKFNTLLFINDQKEVKSFNIEKLVLLSINLNDNALSIKINELQSIIGVAFRSHIGIYDLNFIERAKIDLEIPNFNIISTNKDAFEVHIYENNKIHIYSSTKSTNTSTNAIPFITNDDISLILSVQSNKELDFFLLSKDQELLNRALNYYESLKQIYPNHNIQISSQLPVNDILEINKKNLVKVYYSCFINVDNSNITPVWKTSNDILSDIKNSRLDLFRTILGLVSTKTVFPDIEKFEKIKVLSIYGDQNFLSSVNSCFKTKYETSYSNGIWACINRFRKEFYFCLYSNFSFDNIENLKVLCFLNAVSNYILICPKENEEIIYKSLEIARSRFPEIENSSRILFCYQRTQKPVISNCNVTVFSESIQDELRYLLTTFNLDKSRWNTRDLMLTIKGAMVSLFLDDDIDFYHRLAGRPTDLELQKLIVIKSGFNLIESFQLNRNPNSLRCRSLCPACSAMCILSESHNQEGSPHSARFHRKIKNKYAFSKYMENIFTCDLYCAGYPGSHSHTMPCVGGCRGDHEKDNWKHYSLGKQFDVTKTVYPYDKVKCETWWSYHNWKLNNH